MTDLKTTDPSRGPTWGRLVKRLNKRVIRTVSLISIPVLDAAVLVVGYYIENKYHLWINASSRFYEAAKLISSGIFLLLYSVLVWHHVKEEFNDTWQD